MTEGEKIKLIRKEQKLSQRKVEDDAGLPRSYLSRIESGSVSVGIDTYKRIMQAMGHDVKEVRKFDE